MLQSLCPVGCLSVYFLNWNSQQGRDRAMSGCNKKIIWPILSLYYEESLVSSNLNSNLLGFHCPHPKLYILWERSSIFKVLLNSSRPKYFLQTNFHSFLVWVFPLYFNFISNPLFIQDQTYIFMSNITKNPVILGSFFR